MPPATPTRQQLGKFSVLATLYLAQGLPFGFFVQALPAVLRERGVSLSKVGLVSLLAIPWALKFIWAPAVDRYGSARLGRRRSWLLPIQLCTVVLLMGVSALNLERHMTWILAAVLFANLLAATQDIATDGLAVDILTPNERGVGNGVQVAGYRVGMILGGGALLYALDRIGWRSTFLIMAALLALTTVPTLLFHEPPAPATPESRKPQGSVWEFIKRPAMKPWLLVLLVYKSGVALAVGMLRPFLIDQGVTLAQLGVMLGTVGFLAGLLGALIGGALVTRIGRVKAVGAFGVLQSLGTLGLVLACLVPSHALFYVIISFEHLAGGMATAAIFTMMMDRCAKDTAATDYTVQASVVVIATGGVGAISGFVAQAIGYGWHFTLAALLSALGALAAWRAAKPLPEQQPAN